MIEEEAGRQAREVEKTRGRSNELLTLGYERAVEWLEDAQRLGSQVAGRDSDHQAVHGLPEVFWREQEQTAKSSGPKRTMREIERIVKEVEA